MRLPDAVRTVGRLILRGGVPPGVGMDDDRRAREVEPRAARLERNQEHRRIVGVETVHQLEPLLLRRCARDREVTHTRRVEFVGN